MPNLKDSFSSLYVTSRYTPSKPKSSENEGYHYLGIAWLLSSIRDKDDKYTNSEHFRNLARMCNVSPKLLRSLTPKQASKAYDTFVTSMKSEKR